MKLVPKLSSGVLFALVFSSMTLAAQAAGQTSFGQASGGLGTMGQADAARTVAAAPTPVYCPVSLRAQHVADGSLMQTESRHPTKIGQSLHLTLVNPHSRRIVKATITIYGLSDKARITQTAMRGDPSDVVRTLTVQFSAASRGPVAGDVRVPGMTAVQRIDLDSVTYADGTTESFAGQQACRVTPDPFMPVADR